EGGLKHIFRVVVVAKDTAAHAPNHRSVPPHEGFQSRFFPAAEVVPQQLPIGPPRSVAQEHRPAKVRDDLANRARSHVLSLVRAMLVLYLTTTRWRPFDALFCLKAGGRLTTGCS